MGDDVQSMVKTAALGVAATVGKKVWDRMTESADDKNLRLTSALVVEKRPMVDKTRDLPRACRPPHFAKEGHAHP